MKKAFIFSIAMNFIAAIVLVGAGSGEMNDLGTSIPALLCLGAGLWGLAALRKNK